jgi:hypothetical protein
MRVMLGARWAEPTPDTRDRKAKQPDLSQSGDLAKIETLDVATGVEHTEDPNSFRPHLVEDHTVAVQEATRASSSLSQIP